MHRYYENKNVLITGAAGFIGMHTSIAFLKKGYNVIGLDNMNNYYSVDLKKDRIKNIKLNESSLKGDFIFLEEDLNSSVWDKLDHMSVDIVIHLAAQAGVRYSIENPNAYLKSNILGFQKVLEFVTNNAITTFLYASSSSVYGKGSSQPFNESADCNSPESYYAATKKANELMAFSYWKTKSVKSIGLRFFTVYGSWGRPDMAPMLFAKAAYNNEKIKVYNYGNQKRDFTHVDDIVESILMLTYCFSKKINNAEIINIGNGSPTSLIDFIDCIEESIGLKLKKEFVEEQLGDVKETYADDTKLNSLIGNRNKTTLKEGIFEFINWFKLYYENINN